MSESNKFCIICGKHLSESHGGDICSDDCNNDFNDFKSDSNLISINGFCNFCGKLHELKKNSVYGVILHRHNKCYPSNSYYSKSPLRIEKEREEIRRDSLLYEKIVYDNYSQSVICPFCNIYSVTYSDKWLCNECNRNIVMKDSNSNNSFGGFDIGINSSEWDLTKKNKYDLYKVYGIEALVKLTGESQYDISDFIRLYEIEEEELRIKSAAEIDLIRKQNEESVLKIKEARNNLLLSNKKIYDYISKSMLCPYCNNYSVKYSDAWLCNECNQIMVMKNSNSDHSFGGSDVDINSLEWDLTKKDKYDIYRIYGIEALVNLTGESQYDISDYIRLYEIEKEELRRKTEQEEELRRKTEQEEELRRKAEQEEELRRKAERRDLLLSNKNVYDFDSNLLFCPYCGNYSVEYFNKSNNWFCNKCKTHIVMQNSRSPHPFFLGACSSSEFDFTNEDKYKIYKYYGTESLVKLTGDTPNEIKNVIGSYFEKGCTSIGDNCLYYGHFKEANAAKQIGSIDNLFEKSKRDCSSLRNEIYNFLDSIEDVQSYLSEAQQKLLDIEYVSIKQTIDAIYEQIEDYIVAVANTYIKKGEKVSLRENEDNLLANTAGETFDGFCWNYAKKGDLVGVCTVPSYALNQTKQMFEDFKIRFEESNDVMIFEKKLNELDLSFLERETISIIIQNDGIFQSQLWRELDIDSRKCSRIVTSLFKKGLINRDSAVSNGARTYRLSTKF